MGVSGPFVTVRSSSRGDVRKLSLRGHKPHVPCNCYSQAGPSGPSPSTPSPAASPAGTDAGRGCTPSRRPWPRRPRRADSSVTGAPARRDGGRHVRSGIAPATGEARCRQHKEPGGTGGRKPVARRFCRCGRPLSRSGPIPGGALQRSAHPLRWVLAGIAPVLLMSAVAADRVDHLNQQFPRRLA